MVSKIKGYFAGPSKIEKFSEVDSHEIKSYAARKINEQPAFL